MVETIGITLRDQPASVNDRYCPRASGLKLIDLRESALDRPRQLLPLCFGQQTVIDGVALRPRLQGRRHGLRAR